VREYGGLEHCPQKITANIVDKESVFVTDVCTVFFYQSTNILKSLLVLHGIGYGKDKKIH